MPAAACHAFAAMDVPPDGDKSAKAFFTLTPTLSRQGRGGYETASNPFGTDRSIAEEMGRCKWILATLLHLRRQGNPVEQTANGIEARSLDCARDDGVGTLWHRLRRCYKVWHPGMTNYGERVCAAGGPSGHGTPAVPGDTHRAVVLGGAE